MKIQTKSNLRSSLLTLAIVFVIFFGMAFSCDEDSQNGSGDLPQIVGTAWKIDPKIENTNVQTYLFCKSGKWQVIPYQFLKYQDIPGSEGGSVVFSGTYTVQGDTIISRMDNETAPDIYKMSWDGTRLKLNDGKGIVELYDPQPTDCE